MQKRKKGGGHKPMEKVVAVLNGDQVYVEELIRENARLAVQHEADR